MFAYSNGGEGMIWNQPTPSIAKPCSSCMIVSMNAGLEYTDGKDANTDSLMWLHHVCSTQPYLSVRGNGQLTLTDGSVQYWKGS
jgi:hypothetical protein